MARDTGPQCKQCRREGQKLFLKGERCLTDKCGVERRSYPPGEHGRGRVRASEYRNQLREKQKARRYYQLLEKQFRAYYDKAARQDGVTGENLLRLLERRFDNVLVRLGFAASRRQARQLISHGHWLINGRRVDIPSYQVRPDDVITIKPNSPADGRSPPRDRTDCGGPAVAAGRSRLPDRKGAAPARARARSSAGPGAAHRRALLQVALGATTAPATERRCNDHPARIPDPEDHQGGRRRQQGHVHHRAPRQGLRLHVRQQPAPRAALLAGRRRDHERPHRGRRPRVLDGPGRQGGRHRHRPQPQGRRRPDAHRRRRGRGAAGRHRPRRGHGEGHRPARGRRDPEPRGADRDAREEDQARDVPDDRPRPRLLAGRGEQVRGSADRRRSRSTRSSRRSAAPPTRSTPPASASAPTSTSSRSRSRPTARSSPAPRCARPPRS